MFCSGTFHISRIVCSGKMAAVSESEGRPGHVAWLEGPGDRLVSSALFSVSAKNSRGPSVSTALGATALNRREPGR